MAPKEPLRYAAYRYACTMRPTYRHTRTASKEPYAKNQKSPTEPYMHIYMHNRDMAPKEPYKDASYTNACPIEAHIYAHKYATKKSSIKRTKRALHSPTCITICIIETSIHAHKCSSAHESSCANEVDCAYLINQSPRVLRKSPKEP